MSWLEPRQGGVRLRVHAQPGAKKSAVAGVHGNALKVKIHAPPVEGKANAELIAFLAASLGCKRTQITLVAGELSREKTIDVAGVGVERVRELENST